MLKVGFFWERDEDFQWVLSYGPVSGASYTPEIEQIPNPLIDLTNEDKLGENFAWEAY